MNKKIRTLKILNVALVVALVAAIVATAVIIVPKIINGSGELSAGVINGTEGDKHNGYADVTLYGAVADDGKDDTKAFINAAKTGAGVYVPLGTFDINETVVLKGQNLKGAGMDRSVIRFNGDGTIVEMTDAVLVDDITLTFKEISGKEKPGEKVAFLDNGLSNGAMLRSVKAVNVGTGYYAPKAHKNDSAITFESVVFDKFSHKAIDVKSAVTLILRTTFIKESLGDVKAAATFGGSVVFESVCFNGTKADCPLELLNAPAITIKNLLFNGVTANSKALIKMSSTIFTADTVTVNDSTANELIKIEDAKNGITTSGSIITLYSNSGTLTVDADSRIPCENNLSQ